MRRRVNDKYQGKDREEKGDKAAKYIFKISYFCGINVVGYMVLKDAEFLPPSLLGSGDSFFSFKNHPYVETWSSLRYYYIISLSYHFDSFMVHILAKPRKDFGEMFLHHFVTICLLVFSYISNYIRVGSLVLFIHDIAEIPACLTKMLVDLKGVTTLLLSSVTWLMISWFYTRCYIFPVDIIYRACYLGTLSSVEPCLFTGIKIFICFLSSLAFLHYYWYYLFIKMISHFAVKGEAVDLQVADHRKK